MSDLLGDPHKCPVVGAALCAKLNLMSKKLVEYFREDDVEGLSGKTS